MIIVLVKYVFLINLKIFLTMRTFTLSSDCSSQTGVYLIIVACVSRALYLCVFMCSDISKDTI